MRILLVMRGIPGSGKSTWIEEHDLKQYTLSPDNIRLMFSAPELMNRLFRYMTDIKQKGIDLDTLSIIDIRNKYLQENL